MIEENEYLKAKKITDEYEKQLRINVVIKWLDEVNTKKVIIDQMDYGDYIQGDNGECATYELIEKTELEERADGMINNLKRAFL